MKCGPHVWSPPLAVDTFCIFCGQSPLIASDLEPCPFFGFPLMAAKASQRMDRYSKGWKSKVAEALIRFFKALRQEHAELN